MKILYAFLLYLLIVGVCYAKPVQLYKADNAYLHYVGRIDFSNKLKPRFWNPGVYVQARFEGTSVEVMIDDEVEYNKYHNYIEIAIDNRTPFRVQTTGKTNVIKAAENLPAGVHTITICKDTESGIGYLEMVGLKCEKLLPWKNNTRHKIEFIGNSITCGTGSDLLVKPCGQGEWYDQHNAYMSYGPTTARLLNAEWQLTAVSGIGLIHSCCDMDIVMPQVFDKVNLRVNQQSWDFSRYIPDVVTICLGQNDGKQDSVAFCSAYVSFINTIKSHYPKAAIVMLNSPMADESLTAVLKKYILGIEASFNKGSNVHHYFYSRRFHSGCGDHPDMAEHQLMAKELSAYIKQLEMW